MARGIGLRKDFDAAALRRPARHSKDSGQARRLLALAEIYDGGSRSEAAQVGAVKIEFWFQDEARIGQKNKITRRWARRGTRPRAPHDRRTQWAYIFGAICPARGEAIGLILPGATPIR